MSMRTDPLGILYDSSWTDADGDTHYSRSPGGQPPGGSHWSSTHDCNPICGCHLSSKCDGCHVCTSCDGCYCEEY